MSRLNIIERRELEPIMLKAARIMKHYERASNCTALVMGPKSENYGSICRRCNNCEQENLSKKCTYLHMEAINKARQLGGSYIYLCLKGFVFWTSPFYSGERFAGALFSGGVKGTDKNSDRVKALAQIMLMCADQISGISFVNKNIICLPLTEKYKEPNITRRIKKTADPEIPPEKQNTEKSLCPLDMERMLLACLRRGDKTEGYKILVNLLKILYLEVKGNFLAFRLKAMELAVLLSRAVSNPMDIIDNTALETTNKCLMKIEESTNFDEITDILSAITERMSGMIFSFHGVRHFSALRKAERYIWNNYTRKLSLKEIASASGLSAPYFSTVFKEEMGENLSNYLNKLRVEKAAAMLVTTNTAISEIAIACGFEDQSWFSKIFKNNTGYTPGKYRELGIHAVGTHTGCISA